MKPERKIFLFSGLLLLLAAALLLVAQPAAAQDPQPTPSDNDVNRVAKQMYCPVCENIPLDVCPTQACQEWRELIRLKLSEGWSDQQIKDYFAAQYGDRVLAEPPRRGLNWLVYLLPPILIAGGAVLVWRVFVSMRKTAPAQPAQAPQESPPAAREDDLYMKKLEEELKKNE